MVAGIREKALSARKELHERTQAEVGKRWTFEDLVSGLLRLVFAFFCSHDVCGALSLVFVPL